MPLAPPASDNDPCSAPRQAALEFAQNLIDQQLRDHAASIGIRPGRGALKIANHDGNDAALDVGRIALAWLLAQKPRITPIPDTTKLHRIEEILGAAELVLGTDNLHDIETAAPAITVRSARYPEHLQKVVER